MDTRTVTSSQFCTFVNGFHFMVLTNSNSKSGVFSKAAIGVFRINTLTYYGNEH